MIRVTENIAAPVPPEILQYYKNVHIDMDIMFVNGTAFFTSTSRDIKFIHCRAILSKHNQRVQDALQTIISDYNSRGFTVITASCDIAFEPLKEWMKERLNVNLETCDRDGHVP